MSEFRGPSLKPMLATAEVPGLTRRSSKGRKKNRFKMERLVGSKKTVMLAMLAISALDIASDTFKPVFKHSASLPGAQAAAPAAPQLSLLSSIYLRSQQESPSPSSTGVSSDSSSSPAPINQVQQAHSKRDLSSVASESVCQVKDGESVAIVEIEESRNGDLSQWTNPGALPISGSVELNEIELKIESETHKYFRIENKSLKLTRPLDRDAQLKENTTQIGQPAISSIYLQISCIDKRPQSATSGRLARQRKVIIPVLVKVLDLNDNAPKFTKPIYTVQVDELTPVGTVVLDQVHAIDLDSATNGQVEYSLVGAQQQQPNLQLGGSAGAKQRLVQRVAPTQPAPAVSSTSTVAPAASATTATPALATESRPWTTEEPVPSPTPPASQTSPEPTSEPSASSTTEARRRNAEPSLNLNSEPIINGPMDESDEESDEELLAAMDAAAHSRTRANRTASSGLPAGSGGDEDEDEDGGGGGGGDDNHGGLDSTVAVERQRLSQVQSSTTRSDAGAGAGQGRRRRRRSQTDERVSLQPVTTTTASDQEPPWTNLLAADQSGASSLQLPGELAHLAPTDDAFDSSDFFSLEISPQTGRPLLKLRKPLDYETKRLHRLTLMATDRAANKSERLSSYATILVRVLDGDDQPPVFVLDQGGCATSSIPQSTTPSSSGSSAVREPAPQSGKSTSGLEESLDSDHESEFWDTLGLDDNPLEAGTAATNQPPQGSKRKSSRSSIDYLCLTSAPEPGRGRAQKSIAEYFATVMSGDTDYVLRVAPQTVRARDRDELNAPIRYSFINGTPESYSNYFRINPLDGTIKQVAPVEQSQVGDEFQLWIQAQEQLRNKLTSAAKLTISVVASDKSPPVLMASSYSGQIEENSPVGARVRGQADGQPLQIRIMESDGGARQRASEGSHQAAGARIAYEFDTTSDWFKVDPDGFVYVSRAGLDRDEPHQAVHMFQVTARQVGAVSSRSLSSPISLNVSLLDQNDNPPVLVNSTLVAVRMAANSRGGSQLLTQIRASDRDLPGENSRAHFSLRHVSNNGRERFRMDEDSGRIEALGKFQAGEQFSLTVEVADDLRRQAQAIVEVLVVPGANTAGPQFVMDGNERDNSRGYSIEINEALPVHSVVLQVRAQDPDNDQITYSLLDASAPSGTQAASTDFSINPKTGLVTVANRLDREEISAYNLLVQARDSGWLTTTRPLQITIADSNDNNPQFEQSNYEFEVEEGKSDLSIGRVQARDNDAGENARLTYSLVAVSDAQDGAPRPGPLFAIDQQNGEIRLLERPLDFERRRSHTLLVSARDNGETPRSSSASVLVRVLDRPDELPYFERLHLEAQLNEGGPTIGGQQVAQVRARDPDSVAQVSYVLLAGDASLFAVDPNSGVVSTLQALDYEQARAHTLLIGTNETLGSSDFDLVAASNRLNEAIAHAQQQQSAPLERSPMVRIDVHVCDINDEAPQFEWASQSGPLPVRVQDSAPLGSKVIQLRASDRDGSVPNNQIRFELIRPIEPAASGLASVEQQVTSERCARLFVIDPSTGAVSVGSDLRRELQLSECQLVVQVHDLPVQERLRLSSSATLTVLIDHPADISPASQLAFADTSYTVEIAENAPANSLVKLIPVINKPKGGLSLPMSCELIGAANDQTARFYVRENEQNDCELRTRDAGLDYERSQRYSLMLKLNTIGSSHARSLVAQVQVNIVDRNDNRPTFEPVARYARLTQNRYLAAVALDAPSETQVIKMRAQDADLSHPNNLISYELLPGANGPSTGFVLAEQDSANLSAQPIEPVESRFKIDSSDGIVRTSRSVEDVPPSRLPLRLRVLARDNPLEPADALESVAELVVNFIEERHRVALVLRDTPADRVLESREQLLGIVQERTGLIAGLERIESLKTHRNHNSTPEADVSGTDVWLYLVEPGTLRIVPNDDTRVRSTLFEARAQNSLADVINQGLGFPKVHVRLPFALTNGGATGAASRAARDGFILGSLMRGGNTTNDRLAAALILIALLIAASSVIVVVYQCGSLANLRAGADIGSTLAKQQAIYPPPSKLDQFLLAGLYPGIHQQAPPPLQAPSSQFGASEKALGEQQSSMRFSTGSYAAEPYESYGQPPSGNPSLQNQQLLNSSRSNGQMAATSKEYETQMLKMAVLFDDNQSFDEQNMHDKILVNQNLMN